MNTEETTRALASVSIEEQPSLISSMICNCKKEIHKNGWMDEQKYIESPLQNYFSGLNENRNPIYIEAEVRESSLDKGCDPTDRTYLIAKRKGVFRDSPARYIIKKLGGDGNSRNLFPLNSQLDLTKWEADQDMVYLHIKNGDNNRWAKLFYGITYNEKIEFFRPVNIYYKFILYENDNVLVQIIEGILENSFPEGS